MRFVMLFCLAGVFLSGQGFCQDGDAEKGGRVFRKCKACHTIGPEAVSKVGPVLNGVVGRAVASVSGFKYSAAFMDMASEGISWTPEKLNLYLEKPKDFVPGTAMNFIGLRKSKDRLNIIAYLDSFDANGGND